MNQKEFAEYLVKLAAEEINTTDLSCAFYGYFQQFIGRREEVKKIFKPIENGDLYYERLIKVYDASNESFDIRKRNIKNREDIILIGRKHLQNTKRISEIINNIKLAEILSNINDVEIISEDQNTNSTNDTNTIIYETISDWFYDITNYSTNIEVLKEAYYSINCDYTLSRYLQYPKYQDIVKFDVYEPYFELWQSGYSYYFDKGKLVLRTTVGNTV